MLLLLLACGSSGSLEFPGTIESGVPDSRVAESRLPDSRIADTQKAGDSEAADAARSTTYSCVGRGNYIHETDLDLNVGGKPPDFAVWVFYTQETLDYYNEAGVYTWQPYQLRREGLVQEDGTMTLPCSDTLGFDYVDRYILVEW